jgi:hypothetical protein
MEAALPELSARGRARNTPRHGPRTGALAYLEFRDGRRTMTRSMSRDGASEQFSDARFTFQDGQLSPDGHWMDYVSNETGRNELWVRAFPGPAEKYPISADGGIKSAWPETKANCSTWS